MTTSKPVWLLDIDGVINAAVRKPDPTVWPLEHWREGTAEAGGHTWPIRWVQPVVDFIRGVHEAGTAEIRWHTTWQHDAQALADLVGLPEFPVAEAPEFDSESWYAARASKAGPRGWWKLPAAERVVLGERRPLIWTDDDITWSLRGYDWEPLLAAAPVLTVVPAVSTGLTRKQLAKIGTFLDSLPCHRCGPDGCAGHTSEAVT